MAEVVENPDGIGFEISGYLQKRTTKGYYVDRYFTTSDHYLSYYMDKSSFEAGNDPSEIFDICEVKNLEKKGGRTFFLFFLNGRFKLDLRAASDEEFIEWVEVLNGKKNMFTFENLLKEMNTNDPKEIFCTKIFQTLMFLKEKDQNCWILDRIDEVFETSNEKESEQLRSSPVSLITRCYQVLHEFAEACKDCQLEFNSRNPKVIVHCRSYIRRYVDILKGRFLLELSFIPGLEKKEFEHMGENGICKAIEFISLVDSLGNMGFSFLPKNFVLVLNNSLFSLGQLVSALLNLAIKKIDFFVEDAVSLPPMQRIAKLGSIEYIISESLGLIDINLPADDFIISFLPKLVSTELLCFADHLAQLGFEGYDEAALIAHIQCCSKIPESLQKSFINYIKKKLVWDKMILNEISESDNSDRSRKRVNRFSLASAGAKRSERENFSPDSEISGDSDRNEGFSLIPIPPPVVEAVDNACFCSARIATIRAVQNMNATLQPISCALFTLGQGKDVNRGAGWLGGDLCSALLNRLELWCSDFTQMLAPKYCRTIYVEASKLLMRVYIGRMIGFHVTTASSKSSFISIKKWNKACVNRLRADIKELYVWLVENIHAEDSLQEKNLLLLFSQLLICDENSVLQYFADAILIFGRPYALHIYDLFRLILKFRDDFPPKIRKTVLGLCVEFLIQLDSAVINDPSLLIASYYVCQSITDLNQIEDRVTRFMNESIFDQLCPLIGKEHCTGSRWKLEKLSDPLSVQLSIQLLVTSTCARARDARAKKHKNHHSSQKSPVEWTFLDQEKQLTQEDYRDSAKPPKPLDLHHFPSKTQYHQGFKGENQGFEMETQGFEDDETDTSSVLELNSVISDLQQKPKKPPKPVKPKKCMVGSRDSSEKPAALSEEICKTLSNHEPEEPKSSERLYITEENFISIHESEAEVNEDSKINLENLELEELTHSDVSDIESLKSDNSGIPELPEIPIEIKSDKGKDETSIKSVKNTESPDNEDNETETDTEKRAIPELPTEVKTRKPLPVTPPRPPAKRNLSLNPVKSEANPVTAETEKGEKDDGLRKLLEKAQKQVSTSFYSSDAHK